MTVLAADPDPEHKSSRRRRRNIRELASDENRMAQRQQVHTDHGVESITRAEDRSCAHETVCARTPMETDVVTDSETIETGLLGQVDRPAHLRERRTNLVIRCDRTTHRGAPGLRDSPGDN
jgi:hypothetical protein